ncbi:hypothetical protein [Streptomyces broussonetiae]|uniref:DUF695 domain-containing protein n=1 Tax=Streptomyces broussonetiae TaxID=2686304 RepID=A0ABV5ECJ8_9ACTN
MLPEAGELTLIGRDDGDWARWEEAYDEIRRRVSLSSPQGPVPEFLRHLEGDRAWFRWSDEAFEDEEEGQDEEGQDEESRARPPAPPAALPPPRVSR